MKSIQRHCAICQQPRLFQKTGVNHVLHLILSLVTLGFWVPVWVILITVNCFAAYRCVNCGSSRVV